MHQVELQSFIKELAAVNSMRSHLPMDILQEHIFDIEREASVFRDMDGVDPDIKADLLDQLRMYKQSLDKELNSRVGGNSK